MLTIVSMRLLALICGLIVALACAEDESQSSATNAPAPDTAGGPESEARPDPLDGLSQSELAGHLSDRYPAALSNVLEKRFLRVITSRNSFDFFIHQGQRGGYQYEMVRAFTRYLNSRYTKGRGKLKIQFEMIPVPEDRLIPMLREGAADLIAARMTITPERTALVGFSQPYHSVSELLVTHDETPPIESLEDLSGETVAIRRSSSYYESLVRLNRQLEAKGRPAVRVALVDEALETERILDLVAAHRFPYTVADSMVAELAVELDPRLRIVDGVALREAGELGWATLPEADALQKEMNHFLRRYEQGSLLGNITLRRYFESESPLASRWDETGEATLSPFDDLFKLHAEQFGLDWLLVAAMAHQESRFDPTARNSSGAVGLLQIKPTTAREPYIGIDNVAGVEFASANVEAGLKYLIWIKARYFDSVPEMREKDRLRMALASYNAGPRTVRRARARAEKLGYDPNRWFRNVELGMLDIRKTEPVKYVSEINQRYLAYRVLLDGE